MPIFDEWVIPDASTLDAPAAVTSLLERRIAESGMSREEFLHPRAEHLHDGSSIGGMLEACARIESAIRNSEQILIYGDYDVDGVTSIVLLTRVIEIMGGRVDYVVPHRLFDGYGLKTSVLDRVLSEKAVKLIITVDCGITSVEPVAAAVEKGIDVIITDHHLPPDMLPEAAAVLNPKKPGCTYPFKELAGVGVAFKLCCELLKRSGKRVSTDSLLKIAALGTIADVAPLQGENRMIARIGLRELASVRNVGLRALLLELGLIGKPLRASDVGFRIGPRINAAGRLASANTAIELFGAKSQEEARALVVELNRLNGERQQVEKEILADAEARIAARQTLPKIVVVAGEEWHKGVLGLCAGRLAQQLHRPVLALTIGESVCIGSGRSIPTIDLHHFLAQFHHLYENFGGHEFACGFSVPRKNFEVWRDAVESASSSLDDHLFVRRADVASVVTFDGVNGGFNALYDELEPFGAGNPVPLFVSYGVRVKEKREFSPGCFDLLLDDGSNALSGVVWKSAQHLRDLVTSDQSVDLLFSFSPDRYARYGVRLEIADFRYSSIRNETGSSAVEG